MSSWEKTSLLLDFLHEDINQSNSFENSNDYQSRHDTGIFLNFLSGLSKCGESSKDKVQQQRYFSFDHILCLYILPVIYGAPQSAHFPHARPENKQLVLAKASWDFKSLTVSRMKSPVIIVLILKITIIKIICAQRKCAILCNFLIIFLEMLIS